MSCCQEAVGIVVNCMYDSNSYSTGSKRSFQWATPLQRLAQVHQHLASGRGDGVLTNIQLCGHCNVSMTGFKDTVHPIYSGKVKIAIWIRNWAKKKLKRTLSITLHEKRKEIDSRSQDNRVECRGPSKDCKGLSKNWLKKNEQDTNPHSTAQHSMRREDTPLI